jgi:uncharacterized protein (DUF488 family)
VSEAPPTGLAVFTVGHSNQSIEDFLALLQRHGVDVLVDIRSVPRSAYATHFNGEPLKVPLAAASVRYHFMGDSIGGRPEGDHYYDAEGHVRYDVIAQSPRFQEGLATLLKGLPHHRVALMCSEEDPAECHRRLLVARVLEERGVAVLHLRADGRTQSEADLLHEEELARNPGGQATLFDIEEPQAWKSTRSVSPRSGPRSSSEP